MSEPIYRLIYCSRNTLADVSTDMEEEIRSILAVSRRNNTRDRITGALLFSAGCFAQLLEGPMDLVEAAFERIQMDPRHGEVTVLEVGEAAGRDFPDWSMAYTGSVRPDDPLAALTLDRAFAAPQQGAEGVLDLLRDVVRREEEWALA